ncbi:MAG: hypothetical protein ABII90_14400 [Bacteroidota bacterium]
MNSISKIATFTFLLYVSCPVFSQDSTEYISDSYKQTHPGKKRFDRSKVFTGGNIGLLFGTVTYIDLSPIIGYMLTEKISAGIGVTYKYFNDNRIANYSTNIFGGRVFGRYLFTENLFAHTEYELLNLEIIMVDRWYNVTDRYRKNVSYIWVGGGYRYPVGLNSYLSFMVLYNLNESAFSIYPNPIYTIGVNIGL